MSSNQKKTDYVSDLDSFLQEHDKKHPGSSISQQKEKDKANRVFRLRDDKQFTDPAKNPWYEFNKI